MIGIVGSRRRKSNEDLRMLEKSFVKILAIELGIYFGDIDDLGSSLKDVTIVTGDCDVGGDKFAKEIADFFEINLDVKRIRDPDTGEVMDFKNHRWFSYNRICNIFYKRDEEIAKEPLDYLIALVAPDRTGGTEYTIKQFKKYHKNWEEKLIIIWTKKVYLMLIREGFTKEW